jgi:hypothetical protein
VEQAPAASGCTAVSAMNKQSPLREDYLAGLAQDQVVSALDGIEGDWIWGVTLLARGLARTGRLLIGSSIWLSCDEFMQAIVTRIVEKTTQAAATPIIMTVMASSRELADPFPNSRTGSEPNCLRLYRLLNSLAHFQLRQSGDLAALSPFRPVTLRPCLSTGLPFLCCTQIIRFAKDGFNSIYILDNVFFQAL